MDGHQIHEVTMDYCGCDRVEPSEVQLLRSRYFPATIDEPRTVATFDCLDLFVTLSHESKITVYQYCQAMERRTDNTGLRILPVCCLVIWIMLGDIQLQLRKMDRTYERGGCGVWLATNQQSCQKRSGNDTRILARLT